MTSLVNRNIVVAGKRTSMRFEPEFWSAMAEVCRRERIDTEELVRRAEAESHNGGRTSAMRVHLLRYFRSATTEEGHRAAGHGPRRPEPVDEVTLCQR